MVFNSPREVLNFDFWNKTTKTLIFDNFTRKFNPDTGQIELPRVAFNSIVTYGSEKTTVGRFIFNKFCLPEIYEKKFGYENVEITEKEYFRIANQITSLLLSKDITEEEYSLIVDRVNWLGNVTSNISGEGFDSRSFILSPEVKNMLQQFLASDKEKLKDVEFVNQWQGKIIKEVERTMSDRSLIKIIQSGAKGNMSNNYKNMALFRGIVDGEFIPDNLVDGNSYDAYIKLGSNSVKGSSARAIKTAMGGYATKLISNAYNSLSITGDDCGSTEYLVVGRNEFNPNLFKFRNVRVKGSRGPFRVLTPDLYSELSGNTVELRSPMFCKDENGVCKKCMGDIYLYNGIVKNLSAYPTTLSSDIMMKSMKSFHDLEGTFTKINFRKELLGID